MDYRNLTPNLMVRDVAATIDYYRSILGFRVITTVPDDARPVFGIVSAGGMTLMFQEELSLKTEYPQLAESGQRAGMTFYIHVDDILSLYEHVKGKVRIAKDLHTTFYGSQDFAIEDCNGYILTFSQDAAPKEWKYDNYFLPAADMEKSRKFYSEVLGLELKFVFAEKGMAAYRIGSEEPAIILKDTTKHPAAKPAVWIEVADVMAQYEALKAKGVRFLSAPFRIATGMTVEFTDPSGNLLGFTDYSSSSY